MGTVFALFRVDGNLAERRPAPKRGCGTGERIETMLTRKQRELLQFIQERLGDTGISPSFDEMKDALGLKSQSGFHRSIAGLEERGFIRRLPHRARGLGVTRLSDDQMSKAEPASGRGAAGDSRRGFAPNVIRGDFTPSLP